jgi:Holin of 3TMs, for gene-transfer release
MNWLSLVTGLFRPAKELIEVFKPNAEQSAERDHVETMALSQEDLASLQQFTAEFHDRVGRTWWDSLIDGLNRLPRPLITLGILALFVLAPVAPVRFLEIAQAYQVMPDGFWALLSVIIAFYFGGRMQLKGADMAVKGGALQVAREILAIRRAEQQLDQPAPQPTPQPAPAPPGYLPQVAPAAAATNVSHVNQVVEEWRQRQAAGARS